MMRTTLDIADDVLLAAKAQAVSEKKSLSQVISDLARRELQSPLAHTAAHAVTPLAAYGIQPLPPRGSPVTDEAVQHLQDSELL